MPVLEKWESTRKEEDAIYDRLLPAGEGWMYDLQPGQVFRLVDVEGEQGVDVLFYDAENPEDHYSAIATITAQRNVYLKVGTILRGESGKELLEIIADTCGCHDTLGGACSAQSNTVRYAHEKVHLHNCRDTFLLQLAKAGEPYNKRDLAPNINFFTNVPLTPEGRISFEEGYSAAGNYIELKSICHTKILISNCPQLNNPCSGYNPTPVRLLIWDQ